GTGCHGFGGGVTHRDRASLHQDPARDVGPTRELPTRESEQDVGSYRGMATQRKCPTQSIARVGRWCNARSVQPREAAGSVGHNARTASSAAAVPCLPSASAAANRTSGALSASAAAVTDSTPATPTLASALAAAPRTSR